MHKNVDSLRQKTIKGISWSLIDNIANNGFNFLVGIILARLLTPAEFGIIGMITVFLAVSNSIVDSGFTTAIIRKSDLKRIDYNTAFYFNILMGSLFYFILFLCSPAISNFFHEPVLIPITRVLGCIVIINSFSLIQQTILLRNIDFKTQTKISLLSSFISGGVGIWMAFAGYGVWSLVYRIIAKQLLNSIFLWVFNKWRPVLEFSRRSLNELFGFGSKLLLSGLIDTVYKNIYYFVIGKFYSATQLGYYSRAEQFTRFFSNNLTSVFQRVSYPVLSSIQNDDLRLKQVYRRLIKTTMLLTFTGILGLAAVAKPLIIILIGEKWLPAVHYLQIICFAGMLYPLQSINLNILKVKGRSDIFLKLEIIKKIIGTIPILFGIFYGIEIMLWGSVVTSFIAFFLNSYYSAELINYSSWMQIKDILPAFSISFFVSLIMYSITAFDFPVIITLLIQCLTGLIFSIIIYEKLKFSEYFDIKNIIISSLIKIKK
jgi:teichuronic acid exporter